MSEKKPVFCPDCDGLTRRDFLKTVGGVTVAAAAGLPVFATPRAAAAAPKGGAQETMVTNLYQTLTPEQKAAVCFPWSDVKRTMVSNNWHIVPQTIGSFYTPAQQEMILAIFKTTNSEEWVEKRLRQMRDDHPGKDGASSGFPNYSIAIFGTPGTGQFELVLTGRHTTMRVDGDSEPGVAFGGAHFYGHAAQGFNEKPDHPGNVYWYQALRANEVYQMLDGKQRKQALIEGAIPPDSPESLVTHTPGDRPGIPVASMTRDQQELAAKVLEDLLQPLARADAAEARKYIDANGGVKSLSLAFYKQEDIGNDGVWDVWKMEGPTMSWYFRGAPHVHTWVWIGERPLSKAPPAPKAG